MSWSVRSTYLLLCSLVLFNTVAWLDSLDRYLSSRYHVDLQDYVEEPFFYPSRYLLALTGQAVDEEQEDAGADGSPVSPVQPAVREGEDGRLPARADTELRKAIALDLPGQAKAAVRDVAPTPDIAPAPDAPRILFAGDSMMQGVAPLVISRVAKLYPKGYFSDQSRQGTGLTVKRYFDWPTRIQEEIGRQHFDTLVVFLGPNDPWDIMEGKKHYVFPSEEWVEKYRTRVVEVLDYSKRHGVHVIWVGLPNMRNERVRKGAIVENQVFQQEALRYGYDFLSTEQILGSLDEPFSRHIDHPTKGKLAVRAEDGIHFTPEGLRMISSRVVELITARRNG